jgi:hypothetical protein
MEFSFVEFMSGEKKRTYSSSLSIGDIDVIGFNSDILFGFIVNFQTLALDAIISIINPPPPVYTIYCGKELLLIIM